MKRTAFTMLLHAHDYTWSNEKDFIIRRESTKLLWNFIILQHLDGCVEINL
jgi:hypothetical protein